MIEVYSKLTKEKLPVEFMNFRNCTICGAELDREEY